MSRDTSAPNDHSGVWQFLALTDAQLERTDLVRLNLAVARGIPALADLDVNSYVRTVDEWTARFRRVLPGMEAKFRKMPEKWEDDIGFFRVGMLQGFLGHEVGLRYNEQQKTLVGVEYTNPSDLFLNGLIDTKRGTCANMPILHAAIARRMGWPVSVACVGPHLVSRFDDGQAAHNIEATSHHPGSFASDPDTAYVERFNLSPRAVGCGSDLRKLTAREMVGVFLGLRGRHYHDVKDMARADVSYCLARTLFPQCRRNYFGAMVPMLHRGDQLFEPREQGHPDWLVAGAGRAPPTPRGGQYRSERANVDMLSAPTTSAPIQPGQTFNSSLMDVLQENMKGR